MDKPRVASGLLASKITELGAAAQKVLGTQDREERHSGPRLTQRGLPWRRGLWECILEGAVRGSRG